MLATAVSCTGLLCLTEHTWGHGRTDNHRISYTKLGDRYCQTLASMKAAFYSKEIESASNHNRAMLCIANHLLGCKYMNLLPKDTSGPDNAQPCIVSSPLLAFQLASLEVTTLNENGKTKLSKIDPLPFAILKANTSILAPILRNVINLSCKSSTFPARLKYDDYTSYQPISNLP